MQHVAASDEVVHFWCGKQDILVHLNGAHDGIVVFRGRSSYEGLLIRAVDEDHFEIVACQGEGATGRPEAKR